MPRRISDHLSNLAGVLLSLGFAWMMLEIVKQRFPEHMPKPVAAQVFPCN